MLISGTDAEELADEWEDLGEDDEDIAFWLDLDIDDPMELMEWHISEFTSDEEDEFEIELDEGEYRIQGFGGKDLEYLDMYVYDEDEELLGEDAAFDKVPLVNIELDEDMTITIKLDPWDFVEDADSAYYAWVISEE
jgi:hypothetical protein